MADLTIIYLPERAARYQSRHHQTATEAALEMNVLGQQSMYDFDMPSGASDNGEGSTDDDDYNMEQDGEADSLEPIHLSRYVLFNVVVTITCLTFITVPYAVQSTNE